MRHKARQALSRSTSPSTSISLDEDMDTVTNTLENTDDLHRLDGKTRLVSMKYKKEPYIAIINPADSSVISGGPGGMASRAVRRARHRGMRPRGPVTAVS